MTDQANLQDQEAREAAKKLETYEWGFSSDIEQEFAPKGLDESTVRFISAKKNEPEWMLDWRLKAFRAWQQMTAPDWAKLNVPPIDYQNAYYYAAPKAKPKLGSLDEVDPEILRVYEKLGIPIEEQKVLAGVEGARKVAVDAVFDSVSVATTFREELKRAGVVFLSISEAIREYPELVKKWLGKVVPQRDNYFAALNSAVFSDGTFVWIPEGVRCPMELSTYFRINAENTGQFERTLIVAEKGSYVSYLEGCTAPQRDENQLHAAVVELVALDDAEIKYSTVQNWYPGDAQGKGGIYNFVTKRALCQGKRSKVSWTQVETGSAITWKYPSCVLNGEDSVGEFYSVALTNNYQQADTGTKMIHNARGTRSTIVSKGISAGRSNNTYRGLVRVGANAEGARNFTQCDSLLLGSTCGAHTVPYIEVKNPSAQIEHEATTSKISDDQLFYAMQRGLGQEEAVALIVNGFAKEVLQQLPMEFAVEAQKLLGISLEGERGVIGNLILLVALQASGQEPVQVVETTDTAVTSFPSAIREPVDRYSDRLVKRSNEIASTELIDNGTKLRSMHDRVLAACTSVREASVREADKLLAAEGGLAVGQEKLVANVFDDLDRFDEDEAARLDQSYEEWKKSAVAADAAETPSSPPGGTSNSSGGQDHQRSDPEEASAPNP